MRTITEENKKIIRKNMDVVVAVDARAYPVSDISRWGDTWYGGSKYVRAYAVDKPYKKALLMDFAGGGFINDGEAVPISNDAGLNTTFGVPGKTIDTVPVITVNFDGIIPNGTSYTIIGYDSKGKIYRQSTVTTSDIEDSMSVIISRAFLGIPENERVYLGYFSFGESWIFTNDNIIDCMLNLRGVETKIDGPSLQASEIEVNVRSATDYSTRLARVAKNSPIYYSAGYAGDMSEVRTFYINEPISYDKTTKKIRFTGYDATTFLDKAFKGVLRKSVYASNVPWSLYDDFSEMLHDILFEAQGVKYNATTDFLDGTSLGTRIDYLIENKKPREIIANACNLWNIEDFHTHYVDAGIPMLYMAIKQYDETVYEDPEAESNDWMNIGNEPKVITSDFISNFEITTDASVKSIELPVNDITYDLQKSIEDRKTYHVGRKYTVETSELYSAFSVASTSEPTVYTDVSEGMLQLNKIRVPIVYTPRQYLFGDLIQFESSENSPYTAMGDGFEKYELEQQNGDLLAMTKGVTKRVYQKAVEQLVGRNTKVYTFNYRGDPRMQPRDVLTVNGIQMTVESLTLEHANGGLNSTIVARGGRI